MSRTEMLRGDLRIICFVEVFDGKSYRKCLEWLANQFGRHTDDGTAIQSAAQEGANRSFVFFGKVRFDGVAQSISQLISGHRFVDPARSAVRHTPIAIDLHPACLGKQILCRSELTLLAINSAWRGNAINEV